MTLKRHRKIQSRKFSKRVHRFATRVYCDHCQRSFNKERAEAKGHEYTPGHVDYFGEWSEESAMCSDCSKSLADWCDAEAKREGW